MDRLETQVEKEQRDMAILQAVIDEGPIGIVRLADQTDLPQHKVRYSLRMLENDHLIEPTPDGAIPADGLADEVAEINDGLDRLIERLDEMRDIL